MNKKQKGALARRNKRRGSSNQVKMAQMVGAENTGAGGGCDGLAPPFAWEFKSREKSVAHNFMDQAIKNAPKDKVPAVMIHKNGDRRENDIICIRYKDWKKVCDPDCYTPPKKRRVKTEGKACHV